MNNLYEQGIGEFVWAGGKKRLKCEWIELIINSSIFLLSRGIHSQAYKCIIIKEKEEKLTPFRENNFLDAPTYPLSSNYHSTQDAEAGILGNVCWNWFRFLVQWCLLKLRNAGCSSKNNCSLLPINLMSSKVASRVLSDKSSTMQGCVKRP